MKELKFRLWDPKAKKMMYPLAIAIYDKKFNGKFSDCTVGICGEDVDDDVMQFTGIKDFNGKDIYSGDIIEMRWAGTHIYIVSYVPPSFIGVTPSMYEYSKSLDSIGFGNTWWVEIDPRSSIPQSRITVLGNVHENWNLIEELGERE